MPEGDGDSLIEAILSGIDVSKRLAARTPTFPRSVEVLIEMVADSLSTPGKPFEITFHPRCYQAGIFIGTIEAYEEAADIFYDFDRNTCWRRFIVTKEMCHLLFARFGAKHLCSTPPQIDQLINQILSGLHNLDLLADHKASTEQCTIVMALEILLPHSERKNVDSKILGGATPMDIAKAYLVPLAMVNLYLSDGYKYYITKVYSLVPPPSQE